MSEEHLSGSKGPGSVQGSSETQPSTVDASATAQSRNWPSYWLTRFLILRLLGLIYLVAFGVAINQIVPLIGDHGLLPARQYLDRLTQHFGSAGAGFWEIPSIFWLGVSDRGMLTAAWVGAALSLVVLLGYANAIVLALLWGLYMSFVHIGQDWYSYGWEIQLLETGFLAIFLCPLLDGRPFPKRPPPTAVIWLFRWLIFRIMLGAGLIKMRGDSCWRDLTCMAYHYQTQPLPNPMSWWLHFRPAWYHRIEVLWNHFIELIVPWFSFYPSLARQVAGVLLLTFQMALIVGGNLSFLNWLTIVPVLACFDDSLLRRIFPRRIVEFAQKAAERSQPSQVQDLVAKVVFGVIAFLSIYPVMNMISSHQIMNTSFNRLHLVNTYGAFGSIGRERPEIIFEGTDDTDLSLTTRWKEYEFKAKPGNPFRRPPVVAPYQYRLDWQIWFAAMSTPEQYPWTLHLIWKLLHNDPSTLTLLANNPFPGKPPRHIRAVLYHYEFTLPGDTSGAWWTRRSLGLWLPPLSVDNPGLRRYLEAYGWDR